jgi:two-component system, NtrC family, response regulator AtoC
MSRVLVVDDDDGVRFTLRSVIAEHGHEVLEATSGAAGLEALKKTDVDAVITDLAMPGMSGLELLALLVARDPSVPVVLITAHGSERVAVEAMRSGAYDYIAKPFDIDDVTAVIERALETRRLRFENRRLNAERNLGQRIIAESASMRALLDSASRVAPRDVTVLVRGETGTGKELVATLIHASSKRAAKPLIRFNCAAIPGELAESELFGHAKGAFTGAHAARRGFFSEAEGGTMVVDEVGELAMAVQAKLLRVLQEGEIQPVGLGRVERVDVRIVASTNRDLLAEVRAGRFREDLYYRLAVVELHVPPLRDRAEEIPALVKEFARRYADRFGLDRLTFSDDATAALVRAAWPGNVRQLENSIARLAALSTGGEVTLEQLAEARVLMAEETARPPMHGEPRASEDASDLPLKEQVDAFERRIIAAMLAQTAGNQSETARRLTVSRATLLDKLKKYGLH